jgi:hypothetical protein
MPKYNIVSEVFGTDISCSNSPSMKLNRKMRRMLKKKLKRREQNER